MAGGLMLDVDVALPTMGCNHACYCHHPLAILVNREVVAPTHQWAAAPRVCAPSGQEGAGAVIGPVTEGEPLGRDNRSPVPCASWLIVDALAMTGAQCDASSGKFVRLRPR